MSVAAATIDDVAAAAVAYADQRVESATAPLRAEIADLRALYGTLPAGWGRVAFLEDFRGDLSRWHVRDGTTQGNTFCNNFARNVSTRDGQLVITGKRERTASTSGVPRVCDYTSGYVDTSGNLLSIEKGSRVEIRAKLPTVYGASAGIWPAGWFRDKLGRGEFDLFEGWGEPTSGASATRTPPDVYRSGSFSSSCYADTNDPSKGKRSNWGTAAGQPPVGGEFHTWAFEWDAVGMRAYFDSNPAHLSVTYTATPWLAAAFPSSLELRLNLQIGSAYWGMPDAQTEFPAEFVIDSVRVLRR